MAWSVEGDADLDDTWKIDSVWMFEDHARKRFAHLELTGVAEQFGELVIVDHPLCFGPDDQRRIDDPKVNFSVTWSRP